MKHPFTLLVILLFAGAVVSHFTYEISKSQDIREHLKEAHADYAAGESAETFGDREDAFNRSLTEYLDLEQSYHPIYGNGKLYFNIANSYFQLGNFPFAALYYHKAKKLMPRNETVERNLLTTLGKMGLSDKNEETVFQKIFFFHFLTSVPERLQLIFLFTLAAFISFSIYIWSRREAFLKVGKLTVFVGIIILASYTSSHYLSPIEAIMVKSSDLYRDSGFQFAKVQEDPVLSGRKVEVLDVTEQGEWLKIRLPNGNLGYVPQEAIRII